MDPDVPDALPAQLLNISFDLYHQLANALHKKVSGENISMSNILPINSIKEFTIFVSHLRFKPTTPSGTELEKFWCFLNKDKF